MSTTEGRRSKLSADREREIYRAVLDTLGERGYEALTIDLIAARAHTSKATLYRQWGGKPELVVTALHHINPPPSAADIDTGSLAGDLRELMRLVGARTVRDAPLMRALMHAMQDSEELRAAFREKVLRPGFADLDALLRRGAERGELSPDAPRAEMVAYMLLGGILGRPLLEEKEADADFYLAYADAVILPALGLKP